MDWVLGLPTPELVEELDEFWADFDEQHAGG